MDITSLLPFVGLLGLRIRYWIIIIVVIVILLIIGFYVRRGTPS